MTTTPSDAQFLSLCIEATRVVMQDLGGEHRPSCAAADASIDKALEFLDEALSSLRAARREVKCELLEADEIEAGDKRYRSWGVEVVR
jgi:hypothetical protein